MATMKAFVFTIIINFVLLSATAVGLAHVSGERSSQAAPIHTVESGIVLGGPMR